MKTRRVLAVASHPGSVNAILPVVEMLKAQPIQCGMKIVCRMVTSDCQTDVDSILEEYNPNLVLTGAASHLRGQILSIEQSSVLAAKARMIPTLAILDLWGHYRERFTIVPDRIAVIDEIAYREMVALGFNPQVLRITGNPHFDQHQRLAESFDQGKKRLIDRAVGAQGKLLALYASNAFEESKEGCGFWDLDNLEIISAALKELDDDLVRVVVKLHPRTPNRDKEKIVKLIDSCSDMVLVKEIGTLDLVLASSLVMVAFSTVGIEAIYMSRPCISLMPGIREDRFVPTREGIIPVGYTRDDCKQLVLNSLRDHGFRDKIVFESRNVKTDGRARERVLELIVSML